MRTEKEKMSAIKKRMAKASRNLRMVKEGTHQFLLNVPHGMYTRLDMAAQRSGLTMTGIVTAAVGEWLRCYYDVNGDPSQVDVPEGK